MSYVQGSAVQKAKRGSLESRIDTIHRLIQDGYGDGKPLNIVATFEDYVLAFNGEKKLRKISYSMNDDGDLEIKGDASSRAIPVIEDSEVPAEDRAALNQEIETLLSEIEDLAEALEL